MNDEKKIIPNVSNDITLNDIITYIRKLWKFLFSKWLIIVLFAIGGGIIGLSLSFVSKPKYTAYLSFALIEKSSGGGGLASLASSFGFGGLLGGGGDAFSGDNLLEIMKSRHSIETALLSPIEFEGQRMTMIDAYIKFQGLHSKWKDLSLKTLNYPIDQSRATFTRLQDSLLSSISQKIIVSKELNVYRRNKKIDIVDLNFTSYNEEFSKVFVETLINQTYNFYKETRTAQSKKNIDMMEHRADSIKNLYEKALYKGAGISSVNVNMAIQVASVPRLKQEYDVQLYGTVYAEVLKNLETLKLDMARETPIFQIIDQPVYPLKITKLGKIKGIVYGGFVGGIVILIYLFGTFYLKENI